MESAIDQGRIAVVGYALGGTAAFLVAGATFDIDRYARSCAEGGPDCAWYAAERITPDDMRERSHAEPLHDARITFAVAVEPEYLSAFEADTATSGHSMLTVSLGQSDATRAHIRNVEISGAKGFDAFAVCKEAGPVILIEEEGDAAICGASPEDRRLAHEGIVSAITSFILKGAAQPTLQ